MYDRLARPKSDVHMVKIEDFPELKLITWNIHLSELTEEEAYGIYLAYWRHVSEDEMTDKEKSLVKMLCEKYGGGISLLSKQ